MIRRPVAAPPACTMRRREWPPSSPSARLPWRSASKLHAELLEVVHPRRATPRRAPARRSRGRRRGRRRACPRRAARASRRPASAAAIPPCAQYQAVWASGERLTSATLRALARPPPGRRRGRRRRRRRPRRRLAAASESLTARRYRTGARARSTSATRRRSSTTPASATPSGPTASARSRRELERRDWLGCERREAPAATDEQLLRGAPARARRRGARALSERGAGVRPRHAHVSAGSWEAALHAAGGACALAEALLERRRADRLLGAAPARPPRRARAGDGLLPVRQRGGRRAPRARLARRRAGAGARLGRAPRQRHQRDLPRVARGAVREHPPVPVLSRHRARSTDVGAGAGEGYSINLPVPAGSGEAAFCSLVEHVVLPAARAVRARPGAGLGRLRRPPRRPAGRLRARDVVVRASWRARRWRRSARRSAPCSRAATTWRRWPDSVVETMGALGGGAARPVARHRSPSRRSRSPAATGSSDSAPASCRRSGRSSPVLPWSGRSGQAGRPRRDRERTRLWPRPC